MPRTSKAEGAGGALTNKAGKSFEDDVFLYLIGKIKERYSVESFKQQLKLSTTQEFYKVFDGETSVGAFGTQSALFKYLNKQNYKEEWTNLTEIPSQIKNVWEKDLIPDLFILNFRKNSRTVSLLEVKYQNDSGSVDEKLQTGVYKKEMWNKLFRTILDPDETVNYAYLLSNWFGQPSKKANTTREFYYQDTFEYLDSIGIPYWINNNIDFQDKVDNDGIIKYKKNSLIPQKVYLNNDIDFGDLDILDYFK